MSSPYASNSSLMLCSFLETGIMRFPIVNSGYEHYSDPV